INARSQDLTLDSLQNILLTITNYVIMHKDDQLDFLETFGNLYRVLLFKLRKTVVHDIIIFILERIPQTNESQIIKYSENVEIEIIFNLGMLIYALEDSQESKQSKILDLFATIL